MVTRNENGLVRVTVTLDPEDVRLLDELARLEGKNRSSELRSMLEQLRPMLSQLIGVFHEAERQRAALDQALTKTTAVELAAIAPDMEDLANRFMGTLAKLEGAFAASADAPASNTGATNS
jgi:hypothetical protein